LGIVSSGVRQIAEAAGSGDASRVARTAAVLRRTSLLLGLLGAAVLAASSVFVSTWTFGGREYWPAIVLLAGAVFCRIVSDGQNALIQGLRRIGDLARMGVLSACIGSAVTLWLIWLLGTTGIAPALVASASSTLGVATYFRRRLDIPRLGIERSALRSEAEPLLKLGLPSMASAVLGTASAYVIRIIVRDWLGLEAAGLYQSAWTIGGLYVGFILQAMGSDFYPRLAAAAQHHEECNRLVNEQALVGLLLAGPGVVATLTFAPLVVTVLYNASFAAAAEPLRWICLGMTLRVWAWPMGNIIMAKGDRGLLFLVESAACVVHVALAAGLIAAFGLAGAAMAFACLYVWHGLFVYVIVRRLTGFRWSPEYGRTLAAIAPVVGVVFVTSSTGSASAAVVGGVAFVLISAYSVRRLATLVPDHPVLGRFGRVFRTASTVANS
jgi:enterobacterial common antigen flippase